ncbi:hypothetical protein [Prevotella sp. tc2-28]|uniref:hypothetical protein n=1 Tax=Prevotella sp. tc2-28 TaxID=1761888 RepID=UPI001160004C|nr:hypothetical protein [Prevotella sp. tc2-28]
MKLSSSIGEVQINGVTLVVIGNGPSLLQSLKENEQILMQKDSLVVNHFCETEYYAQIKPKYYLLADPAYWGDLETYADWLKTKITRFIETFIAQTSWDINLIIPSSAYHSQFVKRVSTNPYIHIFYYNNINYNHSTQLSKYELWDSNSIAPPAQTVLNTAVWLGIFLRYKKIYLIGADTTWLEELEVDQETNELYFVDTHFYDKKRKPIYSDVEGKIPQKLHEQLDCISRAFSQYWELKGYADYVGVNVYNASKYSLIDAFERKKEIT